MISKKDLLRRIINLEQDKKHVNNKLYELEDNTKFGVETKTKFGNCIENIPINKIVNLILKELKLGSIKLPERLQLTKLKKEI